MCHIGGHQDFHGIGVANIVFGLVSIILPGHTADIERTTTTGIDPYFDDVVRATAAVTVINGILLLISGILLMVYARRIEENLTTQHVTRISLIFLIISVLICPITFALNLISANDAANTDYSPTMATDGTTPDPSFQAANLSQAADVFSSFMFVDRYLDYKIGTSALLTLLAAGSFFMNIAATIIIICKKRNHHFWCFKRNLEPRIPEIVPDTARIQYQNQVNDDRAVVIQPLPERPGIVVNHANNHTHFPDASQPGYRNPAFA